jgi:hypothetical protein
MQGKTHSWRELSRDRTDRESHRNLQGPLVRGIDLLLDIPDHLLRTPVGLARFQDFQAFLIGTEFQHFDGHPSGTPLIHHSAGWHVQIDRVGANQGRSIIVHDVRSTGINNPEFRADRKVRPVRRRAVRGARAQIRSDRVFRAVTARSGFRSGVSGGFDNLLLVNLTFGGFPFFRIHSATYKEKRQPK